jgi:hypothetical protein
MVTASTAGVISAAVSLASTFLEEPLVVGVAGVESSASSLSISFWAFATFCFYG